MTPFEIAQSVGPGDRFIVAGNSFVPRHVVELRQHHFFPSLLVAYGPQGVDCKTVGRDDIQDNLEIGWWKLVSRGHQTLSEMTGAQA